MNTDKSAASADADPGVHWAQSFGECALADDWSKNEGSSGKSLRKWFPNASVLAKVSHELRAPLDTILILADRLEQTLTASQREAVSTIKSAGADLLSIVDDILDLARIESGVVRITQERVRISELVGALERSFRCVAEERGLDFSVRVAPGFPSSIECDGKRLVQVLRNLLANAIKFTPIGRVELILEERDASLAAFNVIDTGIGIAVEKQRMIFEPFVQADNDTNRCYGGTGLGLAISAELARLLRGEIELHSVPGCGSRFTLLLPLR